MVIRKINVLFFIFMVTLIAFAAILAYSISGNKSLINDIPFLRTFFQETDSVDKQMDVSNNEPAIEDSDIVISYDSTEHPSFELYDSILYKCTKDFLIAYDESGYQLWHIPLDFQMQPLLKVNKNVIVAVETGGREIVLVKDSKLLTTIITQNDISNISLSEEYITVTTDNAEKGMKGAIEVYTILGEPAFNIYIEEYFPYEAYSVKYDDQYKLMVLGLDISKIKSTGIIATYNYGSEYSDFLKEFDESLLSFVKITKNNNMFIAGDDLALMMDDKNNGIFEVNSSEKESFLSFGLCEETYPVIVSKNSEKLFDTIHRISVYNPNGTLLNQYDFKENFSNIRTFYDLIAINTGREIFFINKEGKLQYTYASKSDILDVRFFHKRKYAVITDRSVVITKLD